MRRAAKEGKTNVGCWGTRGNYAFISFKITLLCLVFKSSFHAGVILLLRAKLPGELGEEGKKKLIESLRLSDGYSESLST